MAGSQQEQPLCGLSVIVTRPRHQAAGLVTAIETRGGQAIRFPVIEIAPPADRSTLARLAACDDYDWLIFVSANAADYAIELLGDTLPRGPRIAAIGPATARALARAQVAVDLVPPAQADSESLLAMSDFRQLTGQRILIVRGEGGREALRAGLERAGAAVDYAEVYRRVLPDADGAALSRAVDRASTLATVITSVAGFHNLLTLIGPRLAATLSATALVVIGDRQAGAAREANWRGPILVAHSAADEGVVAALTRWYREKP